MTLVSDPVEFRGMEVKKFTGNDGDPVSMTVLRFDDESGVQNEFYTADTSNIVGFENLVRGSLFQLSITLGKNNKPKLNGVFEK